MDIKIDCDEGRFKFRVCGILRVQDKYLVVKINDNNFYCLPGGHVELGEDTDTAVLREMHEELGYKVDIERMVCVVQNFFKTAQGKPFHEMGYYYVVTPQNLEDVNLEDHVRMEMDKGKLQRLEFKWVTIEQLKQLDFRPAILAEKLTSNVFENIIQKD
ncbi:MAG: NUDIX domain-containing protein [Clostridiales bacterium]|nr:NUDIX domain-containing protein [Clostridiales bacterium]